MDFFFAFCYKQFCLVTIWERPRARTESFKIPNFRKLFTLKMAFSNGKSNKKVVFYETRELPSASVGFRGLPRWLEILVFTICSDFIVCTYLYAYKFIHIPTFVYVYIYIFLIPLVTRHLSPHDLGETTSSDRKFQNPGFSSSFDPKKGIF